MKISKIHRLRHTFAWTMEQKGAKISEIQRKLGHKNIATTSPYLQALTNKDETWRPESMFHTANSDMQWCE